MEIEIDTLFLLVGKAVVFGAVALLVLAVMGSLLIAYSFKTERFIFPNFMLFSITVLDATVKALFRLVGVDDAIVDDVGIALKNKISLKKFRDTPINKRLIFLPQCLRAAECRQNSARKEWDVLTVAMRSWTCGEKRGKYGV